MICTIRVSQLLRVICVNDFLKTVLMSTFFYTYFCLFFNFFCLLFKCFLSSSLLGKLNTSNELSVPYKEIHLYMYIYVHVKEYPLKVYIAGYQFLSNLQQLQSTNACTNCYMYVKRRISLTPFFLFWFINY